MKCVYFPSDKNVLSGEMHLNITMVSFGNKNNLMAPLNYNL